MSPSRLAVALATAAVLILPGASHAAGSVAAEKAAIDAQLDKSYGRLDALY